jgi:hypothetical protein
VYGQDVVSRYWGIKDAAPQPIIVRRVGGVREARAVGGREAARAFM